MSVEFEHPDWHAHAACRGGNPTVMAAMFPARGAETASARKLCAVCPVTAECLQFALDNHENYGIWGNTSERQRRALRRNGALTQVVVRVAKCGTPSGYNAHRHRGEKPCEPCRAANAAVSRDRRWLASQLQAVAS